MSSMRSLFQTSVFNNKAMLQGMLRGISKEAQDAALGKRKLKPITPKNKLLRTSSRWKKWRIRVFERDKYTCQECGAKNSKGVGKTVELHPHHIKPFSLFPRLRFSLSNGVTLCAKCHRQTASWGFSSVHRSRHVDKTILK